MKITVFFTFIGVLFLFGCSYSNDSNISYQQRYLNEQLENNYLRIKQSVRKTGMMTIGVKYLNQSEQLLEQLNFIDSLLVNNHFNEAKRAIPDYLEFAQNSPDSIFINTMLITSSIESLNDQNSTAFSNSLKMLTTDILIQYHNNFANYFFNYDVIEIAIIPNQLVYSAGDNYEADIFLEARNSAVRPIVKVDFLEDEKDAYEIHVNNESHAQLKINDLRKGKTSMKIELLQLNNGREHLITKRLDIEAK